MFKRILKFKYIKLVKRRTKIKGMKLSYRLVLKEIIEQLLSNVGVFGDTIFSQIVKFQIRFAKTNHLLNKKLRKTIKSNVFIGVTIS